MAYVIPAIVAPDGYTTRSTIEGVPLNSIAIDVVNSSILWQLKVAAAGAGVGGQWQDNAETPMTPGSRVIVTDTPGEIVGIRVRAAIPASQIPAGSNQAVVTVRAESI